VDVVIPIMEIGQDTVKRTGLDKFDTIVAERINCGARIILAMEE